MDERPKPRHSSDFSVAIICALTEEGDAVESLFDDTYEGDSYRCAPGDPNEYVYGRIGVHYVVLVVLPAMGKASAAASAAHFRSSFPDITLGLIVGICGGVPVKPNGEEILLGDVIISTSVVEVDYGRHYPNQFERKATVLDSLGRPNSKIRSFLKFMEGQQRRRILIKKTLHYLSQIRERNGFSASRYPGVDADRLHHPEYRHKHHDSSCIICVNCHSPDDIACEIAKKATCDQLFCQANRSRQRKRLEARQAMQQASRISPSGNAEDTADTMIHFGLVASGDGVMRSGTQRDEISRREGVIAFEMEGAGIWNTFPSILIKGVSDYADDHKNKTWQSYAAAMAAACMKGILERWQVPQDVSPQTTISTDFPLFVENVHFVVPRALNPLFTGRDEVIAKIQDALFSPGTSDKAHQKIFVLAGLGGQGKSEICIKVANKLRHLFWGVFWVDVCTPRGAEQGFVAIAKKLGSPASDLQEACQALADTREAWLLILDNADDPEFDYQIYVPPGANGAIILTSRVAECCRFNTVGSESVSGLDLEHATQLLLRAADAGGGFDASYELHAREVVKQLGSHTLAIIQAGTYISKGHCDVAGYISVYQKQRARLMQFGPKQWRPRYGDVYATFEASASILEQSDSETARDALDLLRILSMLHFTWLPLSFFETAWIWSRYLPDDDLPGQRFGFTQQHIAHLPEFIPQECGQWDSYRFVQASSLLASFSLVINDKMYGLSMHPLTHAWAQDRQDPKQQRQSWMTTGFLISISFESRVWQKQQMQLRPHVSSYLTKEIKQTLLVASQDTVLTILLRCGWILRVFEEGDILDRVLEEMFTMFHLDPGIPSLEYLNVYRLKAQHLTNSGRPEQAVNLLEKLSKINAETPSDNKIDQLFTPYELAWAYQANGQFEEAMELLEKTVQMESTLVQDETEQLASQHALAEGFLEMRQVGKAIRLFERVVDREKDIYEENHHSRLTSLHNLARAYLSDGQTSRAVKLLEYVVQVEERTLEEGHPQQLSSLHTLAGAYLANEQTSAAVRLLERVVQLREDTLVERHWHRLASQHQLAKAYMKIGQVQEAKALLERVVRIKGDTLARRHPSRLASEHELGRVYLDDGNAEMAIEMLERVVLIREDMLSESDFRRLDSQHELARAYLAAGKELRKATAMLERVVQVEERTLPESHPKRIASRRVLAKAYMTQNQDVGKAIELLENIVLIRQSTLREDDPLLISTQQQLAKAHMANRQGSAEEQLSKHLERVETSSE